MLGPTGRLGDGRVFPRQREGKAMAEPLLVSIDLSNIALS
jgi:hypothetical protein